MNYIEHKITLDINATVPQVALNVKKGDTARRLLVHLAENGYPYSFGEDCYAVFSALKPDGKVVFNNCTIDDCIIVYDFTAQSVAVEGTMECEIILYGPGGAQLTSASFAINVYGTVYDEDSVIESEDEFNALGDLFSTANEAHAMAEEAKEAVNEAVALARGTAIAKNTDLDTVTTFGNYKCTSSATVKTLLKCPVDTAFIMRVGSPAPGVADYFYQEIVTLTGVRYYRYGQPSSGVLKWNNWRKTFDTNEIIPARYGGMGANISSDLGKVAHLTNVQKFVDKMNEMATDIGMANTTFKTPSGLNRKPVNADKVAVSNEYNSHTTAYDVLRLMVAVKHTPNVLTAMGSARCDYFKNGGAYYANHSCLGNSNWNAWAEENGYTILAAKGGSLSGEYGEIGANGILNYAFLIQTGADVYAVAVLGLNNEEFDLLRTIVHDLMSGATNSTVISEANSRAYPVGMAVAKLTDGCFDDDIAALANGTYYNEHAVRVTASIAKIMTALVATHYMGNYECSVNYDDLVGGGTAVSFAVGDKISTTDALSLMMAVSDNAMATMLARVCGEQIQVAKGGTADLTGYATEQYVKDYAQPKGNYLTEHQDLSAYAKKSDIPTVPTNVSEFTNDAGYLTEHQDLSGYAKKDEIPTDAHINGLIDTALGVIENGTY